MGEGITAMTVPRTSAGRSTITVESSWNPDFFQGPRRDMVGDSYKVAAVAMDANKNLFVMAETIIEEDKSNFTPEQLDRLSRNPSIVITEKKVRRRREIPIIVEPTTININNKSMVNEEYLTILASIGRSLGSRTIEGLRLRRAWTSWTSGMMSQHRPMLLYSQRLDPYICKKVIHVEHQ